MKCPRCRHRFSPGEGFDFDFGFVPGFVPNVIDEPVEPAQKACRFCGEQILAVAKKCKHCGEFLTAVASPAETVKRLAAPARPQNNGVAAVLSVLMPGLGQIYKGLIGRGILWLVAVAIGYVAFIVPGLILHLICIVDASSVEA